MNSPEYGRPACEDGPDVAPHMGDRSLAQTIIARMKTLLHGCIVAGTLMLPADPLPAGGGGGPPDVRKVDGDFGPPPDLDQLLHSLRKMNYTERQRATDRLSTLIQSQIQKSGRALGWKKRLEPPDGVELEYRRRLQNLIAVCDEEEKHLLWRPSRFAAPAAWKKSAPSLTDVLGHLAHDAGIDLEYGVAKETLQSIKAPKNLDGKTFWETFDDVRRASGNTIALEYRHNHAMRIVSARPSEYRLSQGGISAQLQKTDWGDRAFQSVRIQTEPGILLDAWDVVSATAKTPEGKLIDPTVLSHEYQYDLKRSYFLMQLPLKGLPKPALVDIDYTVRLRVSPRRIVRVTDLSRPAELMDPPGAFTFTRMQPHDSDYQRSSGTVHMIMGRVNADDGRDEDIFNSVCCRALDKEGKAIPMSNSVWNYGRGGVVYWGFPRQPHTLEFILPNDRRSIQKTETLRFKNVRISPDS